MKDSPYIDDRKASSHCVGVPEDLGKRLPPCLLAQIVLEQIDYVVDCRNQTITPNPESEPGVLTLELY